MLRNAKVGDRVKVCKVYGQEVYRMGELVSRWPLGATLGTITRKQIYYDESPHIWVTPVHPEGKGETRFRPEELERI